MLLIQYDPADSTPGILEHAMYIVQQRHALLAATASTASEQQSSQVTKYVALVVHLPPGTSRTRRSVALDFSRRWAFIFVDDLRPEKQSAEGLPQTNPVGGAPEDGEAIVSRRSLPQLLGRSLYDLLADTSDNGLPLQPLIRAEARTALGRALPPTHELDAVDIAAHHSYTARVRCVSNLLADIPEFAQLVGIGVLAVLERHAAPDGQGMHLQVVQSRAFGGTSRDAVRGATRRLMVEALAHVFAVLDENFNLLLLRRLSESKIGAASSDGGQAAGTALWHCLARCTALLDWAVVARGAKLGGPDGAARGAGSAALELVGNSGKHGPLVGAFPFSGRLVKLLESKDIREAVRGLAAAGEGVDGDGSGPEARMAALITSVLGAEAASLIEQFSAALPNAYLHDMVASTTPRFAGLTFDSQLRLHSLVLGAYASSLSPGAVHALMWANERRLQHAARLLGSIEQEGASLEASDALSRLALPDKAAISEGGNVNPQLARVDLGVVRAVLDVMWRETERAIRGDAVAEATREVWRSALNRARLVAADVEALLHIGTISSRDAPSIGGPAPSKAPQPVQGVDDVSQGLGLAAVRWRGLVVVNLFAQEVLLGAAAEARGGAPVERQMVERLAEAACGFCLFHAELPDR